jgi:hypothetical protein
MKNKLLLAALVFGWALARLSAQPVRYLNEVFDDLELSVDVPYGANTTVLFINILPPIKQLLLADVYQPAGDTATQRPLAILAHTGNFLPKNLGLGILQGAKDDSCLVYLAHRLAKRGYVVAVIANRQGWNPVTISSQERRFSLANAMYRGIQDINTGVRFFKKNAAAYRIHPEKIMVWGDGSGGILALNAASLESHEEWLLPQFFMPGNPPLQMVQESVNGDVFGTSTGIVPVGYPLYMPGDTLCHPNHPGYDSGFQLAVSMGGGLIDTSWIHAGEPAMIAFHGLPNLFMPYAECGSACLPGGLPGGEPVIIACGSYVTIENALAKGNNAVFEGLQFPGDYSQIANARSGGLDGLFPLTALHDSVFNVPIPEPWNWWSDDWAPGSIPPEVAKPYLDTMLAYVAPRACLALGLECAGLTSTRNASSPAPASAIAFAPNPTSGWVQASIPVNSAHQGQIRIIDANGRSLRLLDTAENNVGLDFSGWPAGVYFVIWRVEGRIFQGRVMVH